MSKIERYKNLNEAANKAKDIVLTAQRSGNTAQVHHALVEDRTYCTVRFSFVSRRGDRHEYETSEMLGDCIGRACEALKDQIFSKAIEIAFDDVEKARIAAKEEALNVLKATEEVA